MNGEISWIMDRQRLTTQVRLNSRKDFARLES